MSASPSAFRLEIHADRAIPLRPARRAEGLVFERDVLRLRRFFDLLKQVHTGAVFIGQVRLLRRQPRLALRPEIALREQTLHRFQLTVARARSRCATPPGA